MISHPENSFSSRFARFHHLRRQIDRPQYIAPYYRLRLASLGVLPYAEPQASTVNYGVLHYEHCWGSQIGAATMGPLLFVDAMCNATLPSRQKFHWAYWNSPSIILGTLGWSNKAYSSLMAGAHSFDSPQAQGWISLVSHRNQSRYGCLKGNI